MNSSIIYQIGPMLEPNSSITPSTFLFNVTASGYTIDHMGLSGTDWNTVQRANGGGGGIGVNFSNSSITSGSVTNDAFNYFWGIGMGASGGESSIQVIDNYGIGDGADCFNPNVNNSVIANNHMIHCGTGGIEGAGTNNSITGNIGSGSYICMTLGGGRLSGNNTVTGNTCNNNYIGFSLAVGEQGDTFSGNTASQNDYFGMDIVQQGITTTTDKTCSQSAGSFTLTCSDGPFLSSYVMNDILIQGSGPSGTNQYCTIAAVLSPRQVTVSCKASSPLSNGTTAIATTWIHFIQRNLISNNSFYSNGCTTFAVCNTRHIPPGGGQGIYVAAGNNTFKTTASAIRAYLASSSIMEFSHRR